MAGTSTGSTRRPTSDWQGLLRDAIRLLDTLKEPPKWTFGGGTALAVFYEHRISYDVDIFLSNAEAVTDLSPARNPATKALLGRSEEHTSELQSLMRISYAVFCLKKKKNNNKINTN